MIAATSEAARLACPATPLAESCVALRPGHCTFRDILLHGTDAESDGAAARDRLCALERRGAMVLNERPHLLIYRHSSHGVRTLGVVGACPTGELGLPGMSAPIGIPERDGDDAADESRYLDAVGAHLEPVTIAIPACPDLNALLMRDTNERPRMHFVGPDRATHTIWSVPDPTELLDCVGRIHSATVVNNAQAAVAAMRLAVRSESTIHARALSPRAAATTTNGPYDEATHMLVLLILEESVGRCGLEIRIDPDDATQLDRTTLTRILDARLNGAATTSAPPKGTATVTGDSHAPAVMHLPDHGRTHDLLHVEHALRNAGIRFSICPVNAAPSTGDQATGTSTSNGTGSCAVASTGPGTGLVQQATCASTLRLSLHGLSINDLRRTCMAASGQRDGLPPRSCWLPPVPLSGLVVHPFR